MDTMIKDKMISIFSEVFGINEEEVVDDLAYASIQAWDSVAHMAMVAEVEEVFDIMMDTDDIIDMSTFKVSVQIVERVIAEQNV